MYKYSILVGRILYSLIFILGSLNLFTRAMIEVVTAQGLPMARLLVPLAGILALWGGMSVALGYKTRVGACLLMLFLVPVTIKMHNFWAVQDPFLIQIQMSMFFNSDVAYAGSKPRMPQVLLPSIPLPMSSGL